MNNKAAWAWCLLGSVLAGCDFQKKDIALYQKELDSLPGATAPLPDTQSPLTLFDALRLAERNDESLRLSGETYLQALIARDKSFSTFMPTISLNPAYSESERVHGIPGPFHTFQIPLEGNMNLFNGFRDESTIEEDTHTAEQDRQLLLNEQQTILLDVVQTYYAVLTSQRQVTVFQNSLAEQDERVRQAKAEFQYGNGTPLNVAQSESQASSTRVSLVNAQAGVKTGRAMLQFLIGVPVADRPLSDGYLPPEDLGTSLDPWLTEAFNNRQDLIAADAAVLAAEQGVRVAWGEYFPSVTFDPSYLIYSETPPLQQKWFFGLSATIPIFTAGQNEADVRNAYSLLRAAELTLSQTHKQVEDDIRTSWANLQNSRQEIDELRVELSASTDALVLAQRQFNVGLATNLDVLTAEDDLLSTQLQLATQEYQDKINYLDLLRVAGRLTLKDAAPNAQPTTEPGNPLETTTPNVVQSTVRPPK